MPLQWLATALLRSRIDIEKAIAMILASRDFGELDEEWKVNCPFEEVVCDGN